MSVPDQQVFQLMSEATPARAPQAKAMAAVSPEERQIGAFLAEYFPGYQPPGGTAEAEVEIIAGILHYVSSRFGAMKYILGLALDFTLLAQKLALVDGAADAVRPTLTEEAIFARYELVTERGGKTANTLTLKYGNTSQGIRKIEEAVVELFHGLNRSEYPSAYVYNTGQWQKYKDLLTLCFQLSKAGRYVTTQRLIAFGLQHLAKNQFYGRSEARVHSFERIINEYTRGVKGENGGLVFQAIAYGYVQADRPHLSITADKVRTGSSRQRRFGDIDCYLGLDLELSIEVKDFHINRGNFEAELGDFVREVTENRILGIAFVLSIDEDCADELRRNGIGIMVQEDVLWIASLWDWPKQNHAVQGVLHYIAHIEQNPQAVTRLLSFIREIDPAHDCLTYYPEQQAGGTEAASE